MWRHCRQVVHRARPRIEPERDAMPAMSMGAMPPRVGRRPPLPAAAVQPRSSSDDADETVPLVNGGLAAKALRGRQSIAPQQVHQCTCTCRLLDSTGRAVSGVSHC